MRAIRGSGCQGWALLAGGGSLEHLSDPSLQELERVIAASDVEHAHIARYVDRLVARLDMQTKSTTRETAAEAPSRAEWRGGTEGGAGGAVDERE